MTRPRCRSGFTLVELLAVIVILGMIALISYPNIMKQMKGSKEDAYELQIKDIEKAAASFALKHASLMPTKEGEQLTILLKDLKKEGLIDKDLTSIKTKKRFPEDMQIIVTRVGQKYTYEVLDTTGTIIKETDMGEPILLLKGLSFEYIEINTAYQEKGVLALDKSGNVVSSDKIVITPTTIDTSVLNKQYTITYKMTLEGKTYTITRKVKVRDTTPPDLVIPKNTSMAPTTANFNMMEGVSATDNSGERITVKASGNVTTTIPGVYVITYTASDSSGNTRTKKRTITIYNSVCPLVRIEGDQTTGMPINRNVRLTAKFVANQKPAKDYSFQWQKLVDDTWVNIGGATGNTYTVSAEEQSDYRLSYKYEACNNITNTWNVFIDKTPPTCVLTYSGTKGNNDFWKSQDVTITLGKQDTGGSGLSAYGLLTSTTPTYNNIASAKQGDTNGTTWYGYVKDAAGNTGTCQGTIKVDKTAPSCSIGASGTVGENDWFRSVVSLGLSRSDGSGSGIAKYGLTKSTSTEYNSVPSASQDTTSGTKWNGYVEDVAGNTGTCSRTIKVDRTNPVCSIKVTGTTGTNSWYKSNASVNLTVDDPDGSGVATFGMDTNSTVTYNRVGSKTQGDTSAITYYGYAKDIAGNTSTCNSGSFKVDATPPTCKSSGGSSTWTNQSRTLTGTCSDDLSGCNGNVTKVYKSQGAYTNQSPGSVTDKAGNTTVCPANQTVNIDTTAPTCTSSGGSTSWTTGSRTLTGTCSDTGGSKCKGNVTKSYTTSNNLTNVSPGKVYDNAGNSADCPANQTVRIDQTKPVVKPTFYYNKVGPYNSPDSFCGNGPGQTFPAALYLELSDTYSGLALSSFTYPLGDTSSGYTGMTTDSVNYGGMGSSAAGLCGYNNNAFSWSVCDVAGNCTTGSKFP